jgi:diguanylate cyclase (GGDEF)-like protein
LVVATETAIAANTNGVAANYTGFFTLAFIYIGLTQPRGTSVGFAVVVVPCWIYCQQGLTGNLWIRVPIATIIWILVGEVIAGYVWAGKAQRDALTRTAHTDVLTGLATRLVMLQQLEASIASSKAQAFSLLVLDLDGFKAVNDAFGHSVGDELLLVVAERVGANVSSHDVVARLGGDEFAVLLGECTPSEAIRVGERLIESVASPIELTRGSVAVTASVGIVDVGTCATPEDALRDADVAMYEAKVSGKNCLSVYRPDMAEQIAARLHLGAELRGALEEGQFEDNYQPIVQAETGELVGMAAVLRWNHPERGQLPADDFIDVCEELGLIVPLGKWILNQACRQASSWKVQDPSRHLSMAVNLSLRQLLDTNLVTEVKSALSVTDLGGDALVLEIAESAFLVDSPFVLRQLDGLKQLGVRIAIDDFATGYSSLAYLRDSPIDILKIDWRFVSVLDRDAQAVALAKTIIGIADALELDVIAEGVESKDQADILHNIGCHVMQGSHFSQPKPAPELQAYLDKRHPIEENRWPRKTHYSTSG